MEEIVIVGNSGAARECYQIFMDCWWASPTLRFSTHFKGFLSYKGFLGNLGPLASMMLGDLDGYAAAPADRFIIGIGRPDLRKAVFGDIKAREGIFINLISPWSYVPFDCVLGEANIINSGCNFSSNSQIGDGNYFNGGVRLGHDVNIGSFNFFGPSTTALGGASIGNENIIAVQSALLEHSRIGDSNHIHPASVLFKGCGNHCRMAGNPALKIADDGN